MGTIKHLKCLFYCKMSILSISCLICFSGAAGQTMKIENVKFVERNNKIYISYDFQGDVSKKYMVSLALSYDFGSTYSMKPMAVTGDIGNGIAPGENKQIEWDMLKDYPDGLSGEGFVFAVRAGKLQKKKWLPYALSGAGIAGGALLLAYKANNKQKKQSSILIVSIPADI